MIDFIRNNIVKTNYKLVKDFLKRSEKHRSVL